MLAPSLHIKESSADTLTIYATATINSTDESHHCLAHLINEVTTVGNVTSIHFQRTGPGDEANIRCRIRGLSRFADCKFSILFTPRFRTTLEASFFFTR